MSVLVASAARAELPGRVLRCTAPWRLGCAAQLVALAAHLRQLDERSLPRGRAPRLRSEGVHRDVPCTAAQLPGPHQAVRVTGSAGEEAPVAEQCLDRCECGERRLRLSHRPPASCPRQHAVRFIRAAARGRGETGSDGHPLGHRRRRSVGEQFGVWRVSHLEGPPVTPSAPSEPVTDGGRGGGQPQTGDSGPRPSRH